MNKPIDPKMDMTQDIDLVKDSKGVSWWFTDLKDINRELFKKYVQRHKFLDIGCGDGRIVSLAMSCGARRYQGVEIEDKFIQSSSMQRHIKNQDYREVNLTAYDVLFYFLGSTESIPPKGEGEPEFVENLKDFKGTLIVYHRKIPHRLEKFQENLIAKGFQEIESEGYLRMYSNLTKLEETNND